MSGEDREESQIAEAVFSLTSEGIPVHFIEGQLNDIKNEIRGVADALREVAEALRER